MKIRGIEGPVLNLPSCLATLNPKKEELIGFSLNGKLITGSEAIRRVLEHLSAFSARSQTTGDEWMYGLPPP